MAKKIDFSTKRLIIIFLSVVFTVYVLFQARFLILGPQIWVTTPRDGDVVTSPVVDVSGRARNAAWLSLNGRQIFTDEKGLWSEKLLVSPGVSIMTLRARDRFGRESEETVRIIFE